MEGLMGDKSTIAMAAVVYAFVFFAFGYSHGKHVGSLEILAGQNCMTDYECELVGGQ